MKMKTEEKQFGDYEILQMKLATSMTFAVARLTKPIFDDIWGLSLALIASGCSPANGRKLVYVIYFSLLRK